MGAWIDNAFSFYAAYHDNLVNKIIHIICIWPILITAFIMLAYTPALLEGTFVIPKPFADFIPQGPVYTYNWCFFSAAIYVCYYALVELPGMI